MFEIPTLCQAQLVIDAIARLRTKLGDEIKDLSPREVMPILQHLNRAIA